LDGASLDAWMTRQKYASPPSVLKFCNGAGAQKLEWWPTKPSNSLTIRPFV